MIVSIIRWSIHNRILVLLASLFLLVGGIYSLKNTPVDAIPDLSDVQVIIKTTYQGQAPQVVEDQVTYPLTSAMLSVPKAKAVRGFSFYGDSYVYVIFDEGTDPYWARSRVLEYLSQVKASLPNGVQPQLGPDATGVGWVYVYALQDKTGKHDLAQLRTIQDWFLKFELQSLEGVSEIATVGGMVRQYQVQIDPIKLAAYNIPLAHVKMAIQEANMEVGASVIEMAEAEYMVRARGYIKSLDDLESLPLGTNIDGVPVLLKNIAQVSFGPQMRRGISELNGEGESVGGIVVMRYGENAQQVIDTVEDKLDELRHSLPEGVEIVTVYDRSTLIQSAIDNLWQKLSEELLLVALVCMLFLFHVRSSLVAVISIPVGVLTAFIVMNLQGINANIMSLAGIAIAIGEMIDGAIVMIENLHKKMETQKVTKENRWQIVTESACEVGPALFFSLLIITVSFVPVFALEAQEGRMFSPLAFTKTYAMAASAALAITLVPVLMGYFVRGKIKSEEQNPINKILLYLYRPSINLILKAPKTILLLVVLISASSYWPLKHIGEEFMPPLDEGDMMYMPTTYPGLSVGKAREILQQTDKLIKTVPEVQNVFGKIGRAETATDPAPLTMIETFIQLKPKDQWRPGITSDDLKNEFDQLVKFPGLSNAWVMPIKTRIDMLATGVKTPVGIRVSGPDLNVIQDLGVQIEQALQGFAGVASVYSERVSSGRYIDIEIDRLSAARYEMNISDVQAIIDSAIGGKNIGQTVEGLERYPINMRFPQDYRNSPEAIADLIFVSPQKQLLRLGDLATVKIVDGPAGIKSENARPVAWVYVDLNTSDIGGFVEKAKVHIQSAIELPSGYSIAWAGQYEYMQRANEKLQLIIPLTLGIIIFILFLNFRNFTQIFFVLLTLPLSLVGSLWFLYWMNFNFSISVAVSFIALAGIAAETAILMLTYLEQHWQKETSSGAITNRQQLKEAVCYAASRRVRPVAMTAAATVFGLLPFAFGQGTGSEIMNRLAAPMIGGMISSVILTLWVLPVLYYLWRQKYIK